ncbi:outer membrane beta-barrel protein [Arundinibacter roseus]|uniref:Outer membrane protein beta-barrel domain-containing protein n=1 Tax=Arundinibacter roseus TaxID=2070510 RepID=A0A4R4K034_9BACT|nr:outer membrane beta-barrel protein [Arundinibacter roseus]TDB60423.1 hypothetical protein EZE20_21055 [Arundinibacter roseus]
MVSSGSVYVILKEKVIELAPLTIKPIPRVTIQGDTLIIKTEGIETRPYSDAGELMQNMPGVYLDNNGRLTVMGKTVSRITVDGKLLFGGNVKATLNALKSDMIDQLEVSGVTLGTNSQGVHLNLTIKEDRKNGWYADLPAGYGTSNLKSIGVKVNRINPNYFFSSFINHNTINENPISRQESTSIHRLSYNHSTQGAYSVVANAENSVMKLPDTRLYTLPLAALDDGENVLTSAGGNYSKSTETLELNVYLFATQLRQVVVHQQQIYRQVNNLRQSVESVRSNQIQEKQIWGAVSGTYRPDQKNSIKFSHQISWNTNRSHGFDQQQVVQETTAPRSLEQYFTNSQIPRLTSNSLTWTRRYTKPALVSSVYVSQFTTSSAVQQSYKNDYEQVVFDRKISRNFQTKYLQLQGIQSFPLSKKWLLEANLNWVKDITRTDQTAFQPIIGSINQAIPTQNLADFRVSDRSFSTTVSAYYKTKKLTSSLGFGVWNGNLVRSGYNLNKTVLSVGLPRLYASYYLKKRLTVFARYAHQVGLPSAGQLFPLPDSTSLQVIEQGNPALTNYLIRTFDLGMNYSSLHGKVLMGNFTINQENQGIIQVNKITEGGLLFRGFGQTDLQQPTYSATFIYLVLPQKKWSYNLTSFISEKRALVQSGESLSRFSNQSGLASLDFRWNIKSFTSLNFISRVQLFRQKSLSTGTSTSSNRFELIMQGKHRFSSRLYGDFSSRHILAQSTNTHITHYPFADINFDYYLLKNQRVRLSFLVNNIFNSSQQAAISSQNNDISRTFSNQLSRYFMIKCTIFSQKWY